MEDREPTPIVIPEEEVDAAVPAVVAEKPKKVVVPPYGAIVERVSQQCGMNFVSSLVASPSTAMQIRTLDHAFNAWGKGWWGSPSWQEGEEDQKSQIIFTDVATSPKWKEIKKIAFCGPVTVNERDPAKNSIAVYILTREAYYKWRETWLKDHPDDTPEALAERDRKQKEETEKYLASLRASRRGSILD